MAVSSPDATFWLEMDDLAYLSLIVCLMSRPPWVRQRELEHVWCKRSEHSTLPKTTVLDYVPRSVTFLTLADLSPLTRTLVDLGWSVTSSDLGWAVTSNDLGSLGGL